MKIQLSQINPKTLDFGANVSKMRSILAKTNTDVLTVFAELSLSGSPLYEAANYDDIYKTASSFAEDLCKEKKNFIFGLPIANDKGKYNALAFVVKGELIAVSTKHNLNAFDRAFAIGNGVEIVNYEQTTIAFGFAEDIEDFIKEGKKADIIICSTNNVFDTNKQQRTILSLIPLIRKAESKFVFVNRSGAEGSYIFNGGSFVLNEKANLCEELPLFEEANRLIETNNLKLLTQQPLGRIEKMCNAAVFGLKEYFTKNNIKKAVIGLSGGIDSALVATLAVMALGKQSVIGVLMPSKYSTDHSIRDAEQLANNLDIKTYLIPIKSIFDTSLQALNEVFAGTAKGLAEQNMQARARCLILMGVANKIGAVLLNTSNKSEAAVGYGTLYGDTSGGIGVIGDIYKTDVWQMARHINKEREIIPSNSINKAPSAELDYQQIDSDALGEYDILDKILELNIEGNKSKEQIIDLGFEGATVERTLQLIKANEWKRHQCAPCLKLSCCTLGIDRLLPIS